MPNGYLAGDAPPAPPTIGGDGTIYVSSSSMLHAINPDGTQKWAFYDPSAEGYEFGSPAVGPDGTVYAGLNDTRCGANLYALTPDGSLKWTFCDPAAVYLGPPAVGADGTIYLGSDSETLFAIEPNGQIKWKFVTPGQPIGSVAIGADRAICFGSGDVYGHGIVYAVSPNGSLKWKGVAGAQMDSNGLAISADGTIYITSHDDGNLYGINRSGSKRWKLSVGASELRGAPPPAIGSDGTVYFGGGGALYAVGPRIGALRLSTTKLDFGVVRVGQSRIKTLAIGDSGLGALTGTIDASGLKPPFAVLLPPGKFKIIHGMTHAVNIKFAPRAVGRFSGTITITSNDPNNPSATVTIQGSGK